MKLGQGYGSVSTFGDKVRICIEIPGGQIFVEADTNEAGQLASEIAEAVRRAAVFQQAEQQKSRRETRKTYTRSSTHPNNGGGG